MHDLSWWEPIEIGATRDRIGTDVLRVDQLAQLHVGQMLCEANRVNGIARRAKDRAKLGRPLLETLEVILAVIEDHPVKGLVNAVIEIIAELAAADGFADDLGHGGGGGCDEEPTWLGKDFDRFWEKPVKLSIDRLG